MKHPFFNKFNLQYIWRDLWDRDVFGISIVIWFIFFSVSFSSTLCLAFPEISDYKRKQHLIDNPNALRLIFYPPLGGNFNDFVLDGVETPNPLKEKLKKGFKSLKDLGVIQSIQERSKISLEWFEDGPAATKNGKKGEIVRTFIKGRVLHSGDPCLHGQALVDGKVVMDSDSLFGEPRSDSIPIVVTQNFFHILRGDTKSKTDPDFFKFEQLNFSFRGQDDYFECTVKGVLQDEQPTDGDFFIRRDDLLPKIQKVLEDNRLFNSVLVGGVDGKTLRAPSIVKVLDGFRLRHQTTGEGDEKQHWLAFFDSKKGEKAIFWKGKIYEKLSQELPKEIQIQFKQFKTVEGQSGTLPGKSDCDGIVVHSADLSGLLPIHKAFQKVFSQNYNNHINEDPINEDEIPKLQNPDIIKQISQIDLSTTWNRIAIWTQLMVGSFSLIISLSALIAVRLGQKRSEIGLLRMLGISSKRLVWMFILQAWLLYFLGLLPGISFALVVLETSRHLGFAFSWEIMGPFWIFLAVYSLLHFVFLAFGVWCGSNTSLNQSPAKWLNVT